MPYILNQSFDEVLMDAGYIPYQESQSRIWSQEVPQEND